MQFLKVDTLEQAREKLVNAVGDAFIKIEKVSLKDAVGRNLAEDIYCPEMVPDFRRSTVDGYAVKARDTQGAGESIPVFLDIVEEISIGKPANVVFRKLNISDITYADSLWEKCYEK